MDDEYFGRVAEESPEPVIAEPELPQEPALTDIVPDPNTAYLTLAAIEQQTGISYISLQRYAQQYGDRLPHEGSGRNRRYYPSAVGEFQRIKAEIAERRSGAGAGAGAGVEAGSSTPKRGTDVPTKPARRRSKSRRGKTKGMGKKRTPPQRAAASAVQTPLPAAPTAPAAPVADLDRLAKVYQLRLQLKTLDEVAAFVAGWRTRIETEIKELEGDSR